VISGFGLQILRFFQMGQLVCC
jgi:hypothetical protein